jgi:Fic family protein
MIIGKFVKQSEGFKAFIPEPFPPAELLTFSPEIITKAGVAERMVGKLDGASRNLPDADFFLNMFIVKDATSSSQIEGTRATMMDALEMQAGVNVKDTDADDIIHYIGALDYGTRRMKELPFSLRLIRELHKVLMEDARSTQFASPGEFRKSQNWIGGANPANAAFVPPPVNELSRALGDLEKFIHTDKLMPVLQSGIIHAQFETIHPFLDGNGRTGRLMIALFLYERAVLQKPVLFLSSYFRKHQQLYYDKLNAWHHGRVNEWLHFYLDAVIETAEKSVTTSEKINTLREQDMRKVQSLGKREATSGVQYLHLLYKSPLSSISLAAKAMNFSRSGAQKLIERFVELGILVPMPASGNTHVYSYKRYIDIFNE